MRTAEYSIKFKPEESRLREEYQGEDGKRTMKPVQAVCFLTYEDKKNIS
jgi:hypothetical protein